MNVVQVSKLLSKALRQDPVCLGLTLDEDGRVGVQDLLEALGKRSPGFALADLVGAVKANDKKRFAFDDDKSRTRANQGHSLSVSLELRPQMPPPLLYHGTAMAAVGAIEEVGLKKMDRQHVHLSRDIETALKVGGRHGKATVFLVASSQHASETGECYYLSDNGVWLTDNVPATYLNEMGVGMAERFVNGKDVFFEKKRYES